MKPEDFYLFAALLFFVFLVYYGHTVAAFFATRADAQSRPRRSESSEYVKVYRTLKPYRPASRVAPGLSVAPDLSE